MMQGEFIFPSHWGKGELQAIGYGESLIGDEPFFYPIFRNENDCLFFIDSIDCMQSKATYISFLDLWYNFSLQSNPDSQELLMPSVDFGSYAKYYGWPLKDEGTFDGYFTCDDHDCQTSYPIFKKPIYIPTYRL